MKHGAPHLSWVLIPSFPSTPHYEQLDPPYPTLPYLHCSPPTLLLIQLISGSQAVCQLNQANRNTNYIRFHISLRKMPLQISSRENSLTRWAMLSPKESLLLTSPPGATANKGHHPTPQSARSLNIPGEEPANFTSLFSKAISLLKQGPHWIS